ncbi:zinc metalloproteinase nas-13-like isoform X2 [Paramacrobiotus metropolitanus]|nr:zinc metalloproteinase nas-13-like isoform X2 [Paramacrobiotus metropolitanus]
MVLQHEDSQSTPDISNDKYWPNNGQCIPYSLHPSLDNPSRQRILNVLRTIERRTDNCLTFKSRTNEEEYISIIPAGRGCMAHVGRFPGRVTEIRLGSECIKDGIILHELLHALGFYHEQNRPDRDEFVQVFPENIKADMYDANYAVLPHMPTHGLQYDYESILHYAAWDFAKSRDKPAIIPKIRSPVRMGQRKWLSTMDVTKLQMAYGCIDENFEKVTLKAPMSCEEIANIGNRTTQATSTGRVQKQSRSTPKATVVIPQTNRYTKQPAVTSVPPAVTSTIVPVRQAQPPANGQENLLGDFLKGLHSIDWSCRHKCTERFWCTVTNLGNSKPCRERAIGCNCALSTITEGVV